MLAPETLDQIWRLVRSGFCDKDELMEVVCEELYAPGELSEDEVSEALDREFAQWEAEKASWPAETDCDRLDRAFEALWQRGIIALQNAGLTQSDGYDDVQEAYSDVDDEDAIIGYCFYHGQDLEGAVRGEGLYLAFGPADPKDEETQGPVIGRIVCEELQRAGFNVEWNGTFGQRIFIPRIRWQRRGGAP
jgi:hypothetical protein